ncbi:MAG: hypothetical protein R6V40_03120 [Candidatus Moraniibacteriota bacterium]
MQDFLEKIHSKPKAYRKKLAYILTGFFGVIMCFLWLIVATNNIEESMNKSEGFAETFKKETQSLKETQQESTENNNELDESTGKNKNKEKSDSASSYKDLQ